jgi:hypothetical protein
VVSIGTPIASGVSPVDNASPRRASTSPTLRIRDSLLRHADAANGALAPGEVRRNSESVKAAQRAPTVLDVAEATGFAADVRSQATLCRACRLPPRRDLVELIALPRMNDLARYAVLDGLVRRPRRLLAPADPDPESLGRELVQAAIEHLLLGPPKHWNQLRADIMRWAAERLRRLREATDDALARRRSRARRRPSRSELCRTRRFELLCSDPVPRRPYGRSQRPEERTDPPCRRAARTLCAAPAAPPTSD